MCNAQAYAQALRTMGTVAAYRMYAYTGTLPAKYVQHVAAWRTHGLFAGRRLTTLGQQVLQQL